jgi:uncharacterized RmlC-like cupin family protein
VRKTHLDGAGISLRGLSVLGPEERVVPYGICDRASHRSGQHHAARADPVRGISAESAGSRALCAHLLAIPPGGRAKAHRHAGHETAIYLLEGRAVLWFGEELESRVDVGPGDFLYIPPYVPHVPANASNTEWARGVVARTDPNEQESVELLPHLDGLPHLVL